MIASGKAHKTTVEKYLQEHNIKQSLQRVAVMEYLINHRTHPTIDDIFKALHPKMPTLSRTTVYNTLHLLVENNAAKEINMEDNVCHYDADMSNHAHYMCRKCGKIFDLMEGDLTVLQAIKSLVEDDDRFDSAEMYLRGICPKCKEKEDRKKQQNI